ncbi:MAG: hypothetical protein H6658_20130 [Ardenticatenaceae bacterium]|nr:hypothetical protein [Ardenticatenaceae bacterium]
MNDRKFECGFLCLFAVMAILVILLWLLQVIGWFKYLGVRFGLIVLWGQGLRELMARYGPKEWRKSHQPTFQNLRDVFAFLTGVLLFALILLWAQAQNQDAENISVLYFVLASLVTLIVWYALSSPETRKKSFTKKPKAEEVQEIEKEEDVPFKLSYALIGIGLGVGMALGLAALMYILFQIAPG